MQKLLFVLMFLLFTYQVEGWFRRVRLPRIRIPRVNTTKNCFCKAVDADTHKILHDFGSIQSCRGLFRCSCRHTNMITCGDQCDRRVTNWLKTHGWTCTFARTKYTASTCGSAYGHHRKHC